MPIHDPSTLGLSHLQWTLNHLTFKFASPLHAFLWTCLPDWLSILIIRVLFFSPFACTRLCPGIVKSLCFLSSPVQNMFEPWDVIMSWVDWSFCLVLVHDLYSPPSWKLHIAWVCTNGPPLMQMLWGVIKAWHPSSLLSWVWTSTEFNIRWELKPCCHRERVTCANKRWHSSICRCLILQVNGHPDRSFVVAKCCPIPTTIRCYLKCNSFVVTKCCLPTVSKAILCHQLQ